MAAGTLEMTPGSLFMIHDPIVAAIGSEADLMDAINLLRACKDSIINVYATRTMIGRDRISEMMRDTTWMDAEAALNNGFIDRIAEPNPASTVVNCAVTREVAEKKAQQWIDRHKAMPKAYKNREDASHEPPILQPVPLGEAEDAPTAPSAEAKAPAESATADPARQPDRAVEAVEADAPKRTSDTNHPNESNTGTPVSQLRKRLALIMPSEAKR